MSKNKVVNFLRGKKCTPQTKWSVRYCGCRGWCAWRATKSGGRGRWRTCFARSRPVRSRRWRSSRRSSFVRSTSWWCWYEVRCRRTTASSSTQSSSLTSMHATLSTPSCATPSSTPGNSSGRANCGQYSILGAYPGGNSLHNMAPHYLAVQLNRTSSVASRRRLRSASTSELIVPRTSRSTIGDRAFMTAARAWNTLTPSVQSSESLPIFRRRLKNELFSRSFPD